MWGKHGDRPEPASVNDSLFGALEAWASVEVACTQLAAWGLVTAIDRIGEFSPECVDARWIDGTSGPSVGARFEGTNRVADEANDSEYIWIRPCTVTSAQPPERFSYTVGDRYGRNTGNLMGDRDRSDCDWLSDHAALPASSSWIERCPPTCRRRPEAGRRHRQRAGARTHSGHDPNASTHEERARIDREDGCDIAGRSVPLRPWRTRLPQAAHSRRSGSLKTSGRPRRSGALQTRARGPSWPVVPGRRHGLIAGARSARRSFGAVTPRRSPISSNKASERQSTAFGGFPFFAVGKSTKETDDHDRDGSSDGLSP